jgi:F420-non-reducing hydrogenase iron-sulfur subunit
MCSGRIDMSFILRAFSKGADGVFIGACHLSECNYITHGNYHTLNTTLLLKKVLEHIGVDHERLRMAFMSGAEAQLFAENVNAFVKKIKEIGPIGTSEGMDKDTLAFRLDSVTKLIPYMRLVERERLRAPVMSEEDYYKFFESNELNKLFKDTIVDKLAIGQIVSLLKEGPLSTADIAGKVGLTPSEVAKHLNTSSRQRLVRYDSESKRYAIA